MALGPQHICVQLCTKSLLRTQEQLQQLHLRTRVLFGSNSGLEPRGVCGSVVWPPGKWTRCTSRTRRGWELCAPLPFNQDWTHTRCSLERAKHKDTPEGRKPELSSSQDCFKSVREEDDEEEEAAVRTLSNVQTRQSRASFGLIGEVDHFGSVTGSTHAPVPALLTAELTLMKMIMKKMMVFLETLSR